MSRPENLHLLDKQKDRIITGLEKSNQELAEQLQQTQDELVAVCEMNAKYLNLLKDMTEVTRSAVATPRPPPTGASRPQEDVAMGLQVEESERQLEIMKQKYDRELSNLSNKLSAKEMEVNQLSKRERTILDELGLPYEADETDIKERLKELLDSGKRDKKTVEELRIILTHVRQEKAAYVRDIRNLSFEKRNLELQVKKLTRTHKSRAILSQAVAFLDSKGSKSPPTTNAGRKPSFPPLVPANVTPIQTYDISSTAQESQQFCVFCRRVFQVMHSQWCHIHHGPYQDRKWTCCSSELPSTPGCLRIPHCFIQINSSQMTLLTDGARYMPLS